MKIRNSLSTLLFAISLIVSLLTINIGYATVRTAIASDKWETASTWAGGIVPIGGDSVNIAAGITVQVTSILDFSACGSPMHLNVSGTLNFQTGKKLRLPCGSRVSIATGGQITAGSGGGSSNLIDICNATVWNAGMGNLSGPTTLQYTPLPVTLVHFSSKLDREGVTLTWMTVSEMNNNFFTIEKGKDGKHFEELSRLNGAGTTNKINSYLLIDKNPFEGVQYYRLRQTDFNGNSTLSGVVGVRWNSIAEFQIYPNPTRGELFANVDPKLDGKKGNLYINNSNGKLLMSKEIIIGESGYGIPLLSAKEQLKPGSYLVTLNVNDKSYTQYVVSK